jgi:glycosyltransferase involved in cell wall biosynthesis
MNATAKAISVRPGKAPAMDPRPRPSRIVHLTSVHPVFDVRIFHKECKSLARAGYDVTLIAAHDRDEIVDGIRVNAIPRPSSRLSRMLFATSHILRQAIREDADLYHFHDPELIPVALLLRFRKKKVVYDVHENVPADISTKHYIPRPFRRPLAGLAGLIEMNAARFFSAIVPATDAIARRFGFRAGHTVIVNNYPALDEELRDETHSSHRSSSTLIYAGLLSEDRCIREVVQAMSLLPPGLEVTLNLAGTFSPAEYLHRVKTGPGWDRVNFLGGVSRLDVSRLLSSARAGLCLYRPDPNCLEAAPNKLFECMHAGLPVIASDLPGLRAIVGAVRCGLLVNPLDSNAVAGAIQYLLTHPREAEQMGQRGREAIQRTFNWAGEESKLLKLYAELLDFRPTAQAATKHA